jgi:hypothetical protein
MKATFQIPDELYREVKAETAREGRTVRDVAITLFQQWLRQKKQLPATAAPVDWQSFQAPLSHLMPENVTDHSADAMRQSITTRWNEPT